MPEDIDLKQLEHKVYLSYHQDGLLDIGLGLFIMAFGIAQVTGLAWMVVMLAATGVSIYAGAKRAITVPRAGLVQFGPERIRKEKKEKLFFVGFFSATAILGFMMLMLTTSIIKGGFGGSSGMLARSLETFIMAPLGFIGAMALVALGYWKELSRYYVYAAILLLAVTIGPLLEIPHGVYTTGAWGVITLVGLVMLVRFLLAHPLKDQKEISHADD